jgi:hypothetical protein
MTPVAPESVRATCLRALLSFQLNALRPADRASSGRTQPAPLLHQCALVAHRGPQPPDPGAALSGGENLHSRIVGVQHRPGADVPTDRLNQRVQQCGHAAHTVCQGGALEIDPFSRVDRTLTIQRQAIGVFCHRDVGKETRPWPAALDRRLRPSIGRYWLPWPRRGIGETGKRNGELRQ